MPFITDIDTIFMNFGGFERLEFEGLNFNLGNIENVIKSVSAVFPEHKTGYENMLNNTGYY